MDPIAASRIEVVGQPSQLVVREWVFKGLSRPGLAAGWGWP
jgi:hypothetical protein